MSPKTIRYILISGVLFVWSVIIYRVIAAVSDSPVEPVAPKIVSTTGVQYKKEQFYLYADYPDPFIPVEESDTLSSQASARAATSPQPEAPPALQAVKPDLSFIQYHGMIVNQDKKTKVALISFRGANFLVKEKDKKEDVLFKKIDADRLVVIISGKSLVIDKH